MNIEEFFDRELELARQEVLRREKAAKAKTVTQKKTHSHFRPFLEAMRRVDKKFVDCTEIDFQYSDDYFRLVLGEHRVIESFPQKKNRVQVVTHFMGYKLRFTTQPIRFIKQFLTETYLRLRVGNLLRYLFSTYEYPPWDVIERRRTFPGAAEAVEFVIRALAEFIAQVEIAEKLQREAAEY